MKKLLIIAICLFGLSPFLKAQMLNPVSYTHLTLPTKLEV